MSHTRAQILTRLKEVVKIEKEMADKVKDGNKKSPKAPKTPQEYAALEMKINRIQSIPVKGGV